MVCSHNVKLPHKDDSNWWAVSDKFKIKEILEQYYIKYNIHIGIQGEIIGPDIQKNIYNLKELDFYFFNVKNLDTGEYFTLKQKRVFAKDTGLKLVPIIKENIKVTDELTSEEMLKYSNGKSVLFDTMREGLVIRSTSDDRISIKVRSPKYLLAN